MLGASPETKATLYATGFAAVGYLAEKVWHNSGSFVFGCVAGVLMGTAALLTDRPAILKVPQIIPAFVGIVAAAGLESPIPLIVGATITTAMSFRRTNSK